MAIYSCKLGSPDGRILEKDVEAQDGEVLRRGLEDQGFFVFQVKRKAFRMLMDREALRRRVRSKELLAFNQELLVLIKAGLPIVHSLDTILERIDTGLLAATLRDVRNEVKGGASLSEAFEQFPAVFPYLYVASIRAGERTGDLVTTIRRYIAYLKRAEGLKKKILSSLFYPSILVLMAILVISVLLVYVIPTLSQVYTDSGAQLPLPTQMLIAVALFLKKYMLLIVVLLAAAIYAFRRWSATETGRFRVDGLKLRIPFAGKILMEYAITSFTRTFATVLGSGVPVIESLKMSVGTLDNRVLERKLLEAVTRVEEGTRLSAALESVRLMPPLALRMLGVGESTGSLEEMLADVSDYFDEEVENRLTLITTAIEPAIMIFMGFVIGLIVIVMYLPIFNIASSVG
jgi:type IV pilus assembly protein PilC